MSDTVIAVGAAVLSCVALANSLSSASLSKATAELVESCDIEHNELRGSIDSIESCDCNCGPDCGCGVQNTTVVAADAPVKRIYFHTMPGGGCPPCDAWKRTELNKAIRAGWEVETIEGGCKSYPRFRVYSDIKKPGVWQVGFATFEELKGMVE